MDNKYDTSNLNKYLKTLNEKDEVRIALENLSEGNFKNAEKDVNVICYLFIQYNMMIDNQKELLDFYRKENTKFKCNYIIAIIVVAITLIVHAIFSLIFK